ncbi:MAG: hypothetical protein U5R06_10630 [candidate division KSB1 bacterium]|nr:hypothetical protein [candidate division KSB1 bacterium]
MNPIKALQTTAVLIRLNHGKENISKLLTLLYLAEREALLHWGFPLLFEDLYLTKRGPIVGGISDRLSAGCHDDWNEYLRTDNEDVILIKNPGTDELSMAEWSLLRRIYKQHENMDSRAMMPFIRNLPEYKTMQRGREAIDYAELLNKNLDTTKYNIDAMLKNIDALKAEDIYETFFNFEN